MVGTIKAIKLDKGYGFIHSNGRDIFFHINDLDSSLAFDERLPSPALLRDSLRGSNRTDDQRSARQIPPHRCRDSRRLSGHTSRLDSAGATGAGEVFSPPLACPNGSPTGRWG